MTNRPIESTDHHGNNWPKPGHARISSQVIRQAPTSNPVVVGPASEHRQASVKVHKVGEIVQSIEVTCACGEKIVLELKH